MCGCERKLDSKGMMVQLKLALKCLGGTYCSEKIPCPWANTQQLACIAPNTEHLAQAERWNEILIFAKKYDSKEMQELCVRIFLHMKPKKMSVYAHSIAKHERDTVNILENASLWGLVFVLRLKTTNIT